MANENVESNLDRPPNLFRRAEIFSVRVKSGSVEEAGILDGDVGSVDAAAKVKPGKIGAVLIGEEAALKYVYHGAGILLLKPANRAYSDITIPRFEQLRVMGSVVGGWSI